MDAVLFLSNRSPLVTRYQCSQASWLRYLEPCCFLRSAQRLRMASAIRRRPSGDKRRLRLPFLAGAEARLVEPALGRPGPRLVAPPVNRSRACCSFEISASISCTRRLRSTIPPMILLLCPHSLHKLKAEGANPQTLITIQKFRILPQEKRKRTVFQSK